MNAPKQRAQAVLNDLSLDDQSRATLRHALETNDPWLAELVRREDAGEADSSRRKVEALAEIICGAGDQSAAALFVLMGTNAKLHRSHSAREHSETLCLYSLGELNVFGMVDAQIAVVEGELLAHMS